MATKTLKGISFPGLKDTYIIPELDSTLTETGKAADAAAVGDAINSLDTTIAVDENSDGNIEIRSYLPEQDYLQLDKSLTVEGAAAEGAATGIAISKSSAPHNYLDNSDFRNHVNQRGFSSGSSVAGWAYFIDRWRAYSGTATITLNDNGISCENEIDQPINNLEMLVGKTVTCAVGYADGTVLCGSGVVTNNGDWSAIIEAENANTKLRLYDTYVGLWSFMVDGAANVIWAALYEGEYTAETLPEYKPKGYGVELAECQRYFVRLIKPTSDALPAFTGFGTVVNNTLFAVCALPVPMRNLPTVTGGALELITKDIAHYKSVSSLDIYPNSATNAVIVEAVSSETLTAADIYYLVGRRSTSYLDLSADL